MMLKYFPRINPNPDYIDSILGQSVLSPFACMTEQKMGKALQQQQEQKMSNLTKPGVVFASEARYMKLIQLVVRGWCTILNMK